MEAGNQIIYSFKGILASMEYIEYSTPMERILVFSDLHGDTKALGLLLESIEREDADHVLFAGDLGLERLGIDRMKLKEVVIPFTLVRGNCDSMWTFDEYWFPVPPQYTVLEMDDHTVFLTHGHVIKDWQDAPIFLGQNDIFITGHSHRSRLIHFPEQPILLNPGSASSPRDHSSPSYAMISRDEITLHQLSNGHVLKKLRI